MKNGRKAAANGGLAGLEPKGRPKGMSTVATQRREYMLLVMRERNPISLQMTGLARVWTEYVALSEIRRGLYEKATEMGLPLGAAVDIEIWLGPQKLPKSTVALWYRDPATRARYVATEFLVVITPAQQAGVKVFVGHAAAKPEEAWKLPQANADDLAGVPPHLRPDPNFDPLEASWLYVYKKLREMGLPGHYGRRAREELYRAWRADPTIPNLAYIKRKVKEVYQEDPDQTYEEYEAARMVRVAQEASAPRPAPAPAALPANPKLIRRTLQDWQHIIHLWGDLPTPEQESQPEWLAFVEKVREQDGEDGVAYLGHALKELRRRQAAAAADAPPTSP